MRVMNGLLNFTTEETKLFFSAKKRIWAFLCILSVLCGESLLHAQKRLVLDLNRTIALANDSSLESFRTQNMYLSGYWEYRTYKANRLPSLTLDLTPAQYNRDITKRYDSGQDLDVYRTQQSYYAYGGLSVRQNLDLTGGTFYLESNLAYMRNFGDNSATQLTSVPIRIGYSQSLVGYNPFKWERKIEPLKYERVKKEFLYNVEKVSETATNYFFSLAMAQAEYNLAKENLASTDTLYRIGQQRHRIAAISQADLLTLKLDRVNAQNTLQNKASDLKRAMFSLASFLNLDKNTQIKLELPSRPEMVDIPVDEALRAWYVMAAMGLFDVQGGSCERPTFQIGSPLFDKIEIKLSPMNATGKTFVIETTGNTPDAYYVQSATLNGKPLEQCWMYRDELYKGGTLKLTMGNQPNEKWGVENPPHCSE